MQNDDIESAEWLSGPQFGAIVGVDSRTIVRWREEGHGPAVYKLGRKTFRYRRADVEAWLEERRHDPESGR